MNSTNLWRWGNVGGLGARTDSACQTVGVEAGEDDEFGLRYFHRGVLSLRGWILHDRDILVNRLACTCLWTVTTGSLGHSVSEATR